MPNFPTRVLDCDSHSPALLDVFISFDPSICSTGTFPPMANYDHLVVSVSIDFPSNSKGDNGRISVKLVASLAGTKFCELVHTGIDVYIPCCKYQVKLHSCPWFSAAFAAVVARRNNVFCFSCASKVKSRQASNCGKSVLEAAKLFMFLKQEFITSQKLRNFW